MKHFYIVKFTNKTIYKGLIHFKTVLASFTMAWGQWIEARTFKFRIWGQAPCFLFTFESNDVMVGVEELKSKASLRKT